jgi:hypothetical protein
MSAHRRQHPVIVWTLVVLASVLLFVSIMTLFVKRQMLDDAVWNEASKDLISDPEIQDALSVYIVTRLYANVDVAGQLEQQLPDDIKPLAGPVSAALREPSTRAVNFLLGTPRFQQLWVRSSAIAHEKLVNVLENKTGFGIETGSGVVTIDLTELVHELGVQLGLPAAALDRLPPDAGTIELMRSDQLSAAQAGVQVIRVLSVWLLILVLVMYAVAIYLARGARRETLRSIGWAFILVGLLTLTARRVLGNWAIETLTEPQYHDAGNRIWLIGSEILGQIGQATVLYGIIAVLGTTLAGPTRTAVAVRRRLAPTLVNRPGVTWGVAGSVFLLLVLWGGTHALRTWWGILLLGGLLALGVEALRRQASDELAAAPAVVTVDGGAAVTAHGLRMPWSRPSGGDGVTVETVATSPVDELERLSELHDRGVLSDDEFARSKQRLLG